MKQGTFVKQELEAQATGTRSVETHGQNRGRLDVDRQIQHILPRHFRMIELMLEGMGEKEISDALDMTPRAVRRVTGSPLFQSELARRRESRAKHMDIGGAIAHQTALEKAKGILEEALPNAAQKHVELLNAEDPVVAQRSANAILDRAFGGALSGGGGKAERSGVQPIIISAENVQLIQTALSEERGFER